MSSLPEAILLGVVQGLTEFLPVSSTGHLVVTEKLLGVSEEEFGLGFDAAMHLGTLVAVLAYFRVEVASLAGAWVRSLGVRRWDATSQSRLAWMILLATLPAGIAGVLVEGIAEDSLRSVGLVGLMLIIFSLPMFLAERNFKGNRLATELRSLDALLIGLAQVAALMPGVSRSGITISAGMMRGLTRRDAAAFTFLISTPIIAAAGGKQILDLIVEGGGSSGNNSLLLYPAGLISAGVVGYAAIALIMRYLQFNSLNVFVVYRVILGLFLIAVWAA